MAEQHSARNREYDRLVKRFSPNSEKALSLVKAFAVGGLICAIGECVNMAAGAWLGMVTDEAAGFTSAVMIFIGALLTGIGVYDKIGQFAGAGSIVPITGFSNSIVASAMEFKREGLVMGVGAKLFTIAGPVLVYGISASVLYGLILVIFGLV